MKEEVIYLCDGEECSTETMMRYSGKTKEELDFLGYKTGDKHTVKIKDSNFTIFIPRVRGKKAKKIKKNKSQKRYYIPVKSKKTGLQGRKVFITEIVKGDYTQGTRRKFYINGELQSKDVISIRLGIARSVLEKYMAQVEQAKINGYTISTKIVKGLYILIKDGKTYEPMSMYDAVIKTELRQQTIKKLSETGNYSIKDGWRVINERQID
jgi:hypothetical protein